MIAVTLCMAVFARARCYWLFVYVYYARVPPRRPDRRLVYVQMFVRILLLSLLNHV